MAEAGARAWLAVAGVAAAGALAVAALPGDHAGTLDWQPALAWREPWRWWTAAFVHLSPLHLAANLAGCIVVAAFGAAAHVPVRLAIAWAAAWPLTQLALLAQPALLHYGGLSGVLHAGAASAAAWLVLRRAGVARRVGTMVLAGLAIKLWLERPLGGPLTHPSGWDIAVAPDAHVAGALAGALLGWIASLGHRPAQAQVQTPEPGDLH